MLLLLSLFVSLFLIHAASPNAFTLLYILHIFHFDHYYAQFPSIKKVAKNRLRYFVQRAAVSYDKGMPPN